MIIFSKNNNSLKMSKCNVIFLLIQIQAAAVGAVPFVPVASFNVTGRTAHVSQTDVGTQHPFPSSGVQAGVRRPPLWASGHGGGPSPPDVPALHDDQTRAPRLHLRLGWVLLLYITCVTCASCIVWGVRFHTQIFYKIVKNTFIYHINNQQETVWESSICIRGR